MTRKGRARRQALIDLIPRDAGPVVDVGADHGMVAEAVGAIATERMPHRRGRAAVPWVVADGLRPFRRVGVAVIAGMGASAIARILDAGPRPDVVVAHAQDDPVRLRRALVDLGFRIDEERLAPEAGRFAEVVRAIPGTEPHEGLVLDHGPRLLQSDGPHHAAHFAQLAAHWAERAERTRGVAPSVCADAERRAAFLRRAEDRLRVKGASNPP